MKIADSVLNTFLHETHTCNILLTEPQNIIFLYNHYIQWKWNNNTIVTYMPESIYADCHFAKKHTIPNTVFQFLNISFVDFCKNSLNQGFYISTFLNEKYLKNSRRLLERHNVLIYNYNTETDTFDTMTFRQDETYGSCICSSEEIQKSYDNLGSKITSDKDEIILIKPITNLNYPLRADLIYNLLDDYLNSKDPRWHYHYEIEPYQKESPIWGINCYEQILNYLNQIDITKKSLDMRIFSAIQDHKYIMYKRIELLQKHKMICSAQNLSAQYLEIYNKAHSIKVFALKCCVKPDLLLLETIKKTIREIRALEEPILKEVLSELKIENEYIARHTTDSSIQADKFVTSSDFYTPRNIPKKQNSVVLKNSDWMQLKNVQTSDCFDTSKGAIYGITLLFSNVEGTGTCNIFHTLEEKKPNLSIQLSKNNSYQIVSIPYCDDHNYSSSAPTFKNFYFVAEGEGNFSFEILAVRFDSFPQACTREKRYELEATEWSLNSYESQISIPTQEKNEIIKTNYYVPFKKIDPFSKSLAIMYTEKKDAWHELNSQFNEYHMGFFRNGSYLYFENVFFEKDASKLCIHMAKDNIKYPVPFSLYVDDINSEHKYECHINDTGDCSKFQSNYIDINISQGKHNLYFVFQCSRVNLYSFQFFE